MGDTTIIIPTYFGGKLAANCIASVMQNVANAKILVYKNDIGWLKACNKMMKEVNTDVILLNDDTLVLTDIVKAMEQAAEIADAGIVGGMALDSGGDSIINFGVYIGPDGNSAHRYYGKHADQLKEIEKQKAVEGSCIFIKREVLDKVGFFDEGFGMGYREEIDLAFRAREQGYKVVSTPDAKYIHFVSQTHGRLGITNDGHKYFMEKWGRKLKLGEI